MTWLRRRIVRWADARTEEGGYVAVFVAITVASGFLFAMAAISVDTSRWYDERARVQKAADAAALAGVPYLPYDMPNAILRAKEVAKRNGYDDAASNIVVRVEAGSLASQLKVTITSTIDNSFGRLIGVDSADITMTATADYKGPAPMGSPCNTFGNEPDSGGGTSSTSPTGTALGTEVSGCDRAPDMWAGIQGVRTSKSNGDRYMNSYCNTGISTYLCSSSTNSEYDPSSSDTPPGKRGYFWVVRVQPGAVGQPIKLQLYDPAYINTGDYTCGSMFLASAISNTANPYVTDGKARYSRDQSNTPTAAGKSAFCNGDHVPGSGDTSGGSPPPTTSFVLRAQTDTLDPMQATPMVSEGCIKQYKGTSTVPTVNDLTSTSGTYDQHLARLFHNWVDFCTFTPTRSGDYYLQVRTNVTFAGSAEANTNSNASLISSGSAAVYATSGDTNTGIGNNTFAVRAVTVAGQQKNVSVSGYDRMPIFANKDAAVSEFHLIRVLPGAAGQFVSFSFFDVADADGTTTKTVRVVRPPDATGSITTTPFPNGGCRTYYGALGSSVTNLTNCQTNISSAANNAKLQTIEIPIPTDYNCTVTNIGNCWYRVEVNYGSGGVHDFTTWDATIVGDPIRLVK